MMIDMYPVSDEKKDTISFINMLYISLLQFYQQQIKQISFNTKPKRYIYFILVHLQ